MEPTHAACQLERREREQRRRRIRFDGDKPTPYLFLPLHLLHAVRLSS